MVIFLLLLLLSSAPLSFCLDVPNQFQGGLPKLFSLDYQENQRAAYHNWLEAQQIKWGATHNVTGNKMVQKIKRDEKIGFEEWLKNRGGLRQGQWVSDAYEEYEKDVGVLKFPSSGDMVAETDRLLWETDIYDFDKIRSAQKPIKEPSSANEIDWRSDACTGLVDRPFGNDFKKACRRNDFALANLVHQHRWTTCIREKVSRRFLDDLIEICDKDLGARFFCKSSVVFYAWIEQTWWGPPTKECTPGELEELEEKRGKGNGKLHKTPYGQKA